MDSEKQSFPWNNTPTDDYPVLCDQLKKDPF